MSCSQYVPHYENGHGPRIIFGTVQNYLRGTSMSNVKGPSVKLILIMAR